MCPEADRYRVYRNHLTGKWIVLQGYTYIRSGLSWEDSLAYAVGQADKSRRLLASYRQHSDKVQAHGR